MFKLKDRLEARLHNRMVNAGEIVDPVVTHGTDANGDVIGKGGKPVPGTAPKGYKPEKAEGDDAPETVDYTKFKSHAELNEQLAKLGVATPEGWTDDKPTIAEKQAKLAEITKPATSGWA